MKLFGRKNQNERSNEVRASIENPTIPVSAENFMVFFGVGGGSLPVVTIDNALTVPAVECAVSFLARTLATVSFFAEKKTENGPEKIKGKLQTILEENPNDEMDSFKFRKYLWEQVFTGGRGLAWIERNGTSIEALWPMDPTKVTIERKGLKLTYKFGNKEYPAADVIDVPFMLHQDMVKHRGPIAMASKAIQLALAMNEYAANFFNGGGIPPLALEGPMPANRDAMQRAMNDIRAAIDVAKEAKKPVFQIPPGYKLSPVGFDPEKGQMTDARLFQVQEIARVYQIPPTFLQDLSRATFSNVEQNDIYLVKHLISQWAKAFEGECNLKLFGRMNGSRYVRHDLDSLMRGDFLSRLTGIVRGTQGGVLTPNEGREKLSMAKHESDAANQLYMQGATVPIDQVDQLTSENSGASNVQ